MINTYIRCLLFLAFLTQLSHTVFAEIVPESSGHDLIGFGGYQTKQAKSLADIPQPVVARLTEHLKNRMGETQYAHLKFAGVQLPDGSSKNEQGKVPAYILQFDFELPGTPKTIFPAEIWLKSDASVLKEINLPAYANSTNKQVFHSFKELTSVIARKGFLEKNLAFIHEQDEDGAIIKKGLLEKDMTARLMYYEKLDTLAWEYTKILSDDGYTKNMKSILVNAYSGKIIRTIKSYSIR